MRTYKGSMNRSATFTSRSPLDVLLEINKVLLVLGIEVKTVEGYKLECTRQAATTTTTTATAAAASAVHPSSSDDKGGMLSSSYTIEQQQQSIYGHPSFDRGDEIRFSVEICRFENLSGLFSVHIQCLSSSPETYSTYQFIGQKLLRLLQFGNVIRDTNFDLILTNHNAIYDT
ncbi:uncharacterized protein BX663DRAFT_525839 [Cokeromyces recurvatus]|uniref:uncharacterized protein n=1 Tax=Cokeromyces recurvatus TaxID=90255 RepID=UPI00221FE059|nr:uncharacterized protein BX663DRAFT_525839 [Cokeromyces recurvatus]KAI7898142.1 hypothetical protein BX663DRAFT_525839 [Cokeromyces recurvatus]